MKKLFSLGLATMLALGLATTSFAADAPEEDTPTAPTEEPAYADMSRAVIKKVYEAANSGTTSPAETFAFAIERESVTDAAEGINRDNMPLPTISSVEYAAGEAGSATKTKEIIVDLNDANGNTIYSSVGVYTYTITETVGTTAGVTYREAPITLKVTVIEQNGQIRVAAIHTEESGAQKSDTITNTYSAGELDVTKTVTGNLGDKSKYFKFTVTLTAPEGKDVRSEIGVGDTSYEQNPTTIAVGTATDFYLKDGETLSFTNIPYDVTYTVTEADYTADGYTTTKTGDTGTMDAAAKTAAFTNSKAGQIDTGVVLNNMPYVVVLAVLLGGAAVVLIRKRRDGEV